MMLVPNVDTSHLPLLRGLSRTLVIRHTERMNFILGLLLINHALFAGADEYCPLNAEKLGLLVNGRHLKRIRAQMVRAGLIQTDGIYVPGLKSRGYKLSPWTLRQPLTEIPVSKAQARLIGIYAPHAKIIRPPEKAEHLIIWRNLQLLTVDPAAWAQLKDGPRLRPAARSQRISTLQMIERRAWAFSVSSGSGRVFNNFTSVASDLRPYLRLSGINNVNAEVDVSASQLFILAMLYPPDSTERIAYLNIVTSGRFYEALERDCKKPFESRKTLKVGVMVEILFGRQEHGKELWLGFQRRFPELSAIMQSYCGGCGSALAMYLQRTEADVMIGRVVPRLHQILEGRAFLTLHDAIFCQASDADAVAVVIAEEFGRLVGTSPSIKVKRCEIEHAVSTTKSPAPLRPRTDAIQTPSGCSQGDHLDAKSDKPTLQQRDIIRPPDDRTLDTTSLEKPVTIAGQNGSVKSTSGVEESHRIEVLHYSKTEAQTWAMTIGAFTSRDEMVAAYERIKAEFRPKTAGDMFMLWRNQINILQRLNR